MDDGVKREFTKMILIGFYPHLGGWKYKEQKNDVIPYNAFSFYRYIGKSNFRRSQEIFCIDHMFGQWCIKTK